LSPLRDLPVNVRSFGGDARRGERLYQTNTTANSRLHMLAACKPRRSRPML